MMRMMESGNMARDTIMKICYLAEISVNKLCEEVKI